MIIDCATCVAQATEACDDCVVSAICGPEGVVELDTDERSAIETMSQIGLVKPIRLALRDTPEHRSSAS